MGRGVAHKYILAVAVPPITQVIIVAHVGLLTCAHQKSPEHLSSPCMKRHSHVLVLIGTNVQPRATRLAPERKAPFPWHCCVAYVHNSKSIFPPSFSAWLNFVVDRRKLLAVTFNSAHLISHLDNNLSLLVWVFAVFNCQLLWVVMTPFPSSQNPST
ncbi:hypothetical protein J3458_004407 [Metarhizium acridum]|uniref:uncharacterized protein n=1 Tax=Metarhizium acridum TaxID=92637 RepID=UPI001C6AF2AC|nr:hypothetical protein J3458_004407 [Metarhizium acridum]